MENNIIIKTGVKIFISHSEIDYKIAEEFVKLLQLGADVHRTSIFCSSLSGMTITKGEDFVKYINKKLGNADIIFALFSQNYIESSFCMAELGACWALNKKVIPIIISKDLQYSDTTALCRNISMLKIADEKIEDENEAITDIADIIKEYNNEFNIKNWAKYRKQFIKNIEDIIKKPAEPKVINYVLYKEQESIILDLKRQKISLQEIIKEKEKQIEQLMRTEDNEERKQIIRDINKNDIEIFEQKCMDFSNFIDTYSKVVQLTLYRNICHEPLYYTEARDKFSSNEIKKELDKKLICDGTNGYALNEENIKIKKIYEELNKFKLYLKKETSENVWNYVEEHYSLIIDIENIDFWEECLGIKLY